MIHDLNGATRASVNDHFEEGRSGDLNELEVVEIIGPWLLWLVLGLSRFVVEEYGVRRRVQFCRCGMSVHGNDVVFKLPSLLSYLG